MKKYLHIAAILTAAMLLAGCANAGNTGTAQPTAAATATPKAENGKNKTGKGKQSQSPAAPTDAAAPASGCEVILGAPEDTRITLSVLSAGDTQLFAAYGTSADAPELKTPETDCKAGEPCTLTLQSLKADTQYYYTLTGTQAGGAPSVLAKGSFHTARAAGEAFIFDIQADPHRDENSDLALYQLALNNELADRPDFLIDLGDTFMGEKLGRTQEGMEKRYQDDRSYFATIGMDVPLLLVNGNHDGEAGWMSQKDGQIPAWASQLRLEYFPCPPADSFYTGTSGTGNYYAFTWGDALFVMLDPFTFTTNKAQNDADGWAYTLGKTQYDWLKQTLETSSATYKFIFIHNLVGGYSKDARGGAEAAKYFEWGGCGADGTYAFDQMRPGWGKPIHQLLAENHVTAVFHGHDHFYAQQELDGITYQLVPQPSHPGTAVQNAGAYSYKTGVFLPPAGHLRVSVSPDGAKVEYVGASTDASENGTIRHSYHMD
jgi:hypothetical protein